MPDNRIFIVFDTETTGLQRQPRSSLHTPASITSRGDEVCQIGGIILDSNMRPQKFFCHYLDTVAADSPQSVAAVHGIYQRDVRRYVAGQFLPEVMTKYLGEMLFDDVIFIGYNVEFDMDLVAQTLANSPISWTWKPVKGSIVPKRGRHSVDVSEFLKVGSSYKKLSSFEKELFTLRTQFLSFYENRLGVDTNCIQLLEKTWDKAHNAFFDSVNTFLLWGDRIWKKKLV